MYRIALFAALIASGCSTPLPVERAPIAVTSKFAGANGVDVLAGERDAGRAAVQFAGTETIAVRTKAGGDEVARARCALDADYFTAEVITPAFVVVPDYGPRSSDIRVRCTFGAASGSAVIRMTDTREDSDRSQISIGTEGVGVRLVVPLTKTDLSRVYEYPNPTIRLR